MQKTLTLLGAFLGITAIVLGAFGAHALKKHLDVSQLATFETGVRYQMYHALFLLFVGLSSVTEKSKRVIAWLVGFGVLFFSGSIYLLATDHMNAFDFKVLGPVTPIGGLLLIIAWTVLLIDFMRRKS